MRSMSSASRPERDQALRRARRHDRVPHRLGRRRGGRRSRSRARRCSRCARRRAGCRRRSPIRPTRKRNHLSSSSCGWVGGAQTNSLRISRLSGPWTAMLCSSSVDGLTHTRRPRSLGDLLEVHAGVRVAADEAEVVVGHAEDGRVVDHAAGVVADGGVDDLADREPARVARDRRLDQRLGVGPEHLPLAQRREVHDDGLLAAGPVLLDGALVGEAGRQPVAAVLGDVAGQLATSASGSAVSLVMTGSASGVTRCAMAIWKRFSGE